MIPLVSGTVYVPTTAYFLVGGEWKHFSEERAFSTVEMIDGVWYFDGKTFGEQEFFEVNSYSSDKLVETIDSPQVYLTTNNAIGFQNDVAQWVIVNVTTGYLNSSNTNIGITQTGGYFIFQPDTTVTMQVTYSNNTVSYVKIDEGVVINGTIASFNTNRHEIEWGVNIEYYTEPLLPFGFIMGMIGLVSMIGGSCFTVAKLKQKDLDAAICVGFVVALVGYALFIGWLAMGI